MKRKVNFLTYIARKIRSHFSTRQALRDFKDDLYIADIQREVFGQYLKPGDAREGAFWDDVTEKLNAPKEQSRKQLLKIFRKRYK